MSKTGEPYYKVVWPKYKEGEEVVKERSVPPTYSKFQHCFTCQESCILLV